ncbi:MAG: site-2 protease family protein [Candidatus Omnitrophica bacterium]|nr:site-2 protease family protein [Candidatus Omnitrophota bacterium]
MNIFAFLVSLSLLLIAVTVHEFAHGWVAYKLGDNTAKNSGRLSLNPLVHIDPIGTLLLPIMLFITTNGQFVFGAAKPVPINYMALKNPKRDIIWIGASGPASNFIFAVILSVIIKIIPLPALLQFIFSYLITINVVLGVFNLLPIPPLDGSRIVMGLLPDRLANSYAKLERYGFLILVLLLLSGVLNIVVWPTVDVILNWLFTTL